MRVRRSPALTDTLLIVQLPPPVPHEVDVEPITEKPLEEMADPLAALHSE
jgi:hypothetical protein